MKSTNITTTKIVCTAIYVLFMLGILITVGNVGQYIDFPSFLVVVVIAALFAAAAQGEERVVQKFGNGAVRAGWLGSIIGIIAIFGTDYFASGDMSQIGMALAVCSLTILYGYFLKLGTMILD